jgi:hypothetical protein
MSDFDFKDIGPLFKDDEINNTNITENNKDSNVNKKNDDQKASDVLSILRQNDKIYEELKTQPEEKLSPEDYSKNLDKIRNEDVLQKNFISQEDLITPLDSHKTTNQKSTIKNIGNTLLNTGSKVVNKGIYAINLINQQVEKGYGRNVNRFFSKVFEIDTKNKFSPFPIAEKAPHLLSLEKKAVNVDATFVRKCHDKPMQGAGNFTFAELYAEAQSPEEFAFLDMFFAKTIATNLEIITSNKEFAGGMHIAIAELLASDDKESTEKAYKEIEHLLTVYTKDESDKKILEILNQIKSDMKMLAQQKITYLQEIEDNLNSIELDDNGNPNLKKFNPVNYKGPHFSIDDNKKMGTGVHPYSGIGSMMYKNENLDKLKKIDQLNAGKYALHDLYNQIQLCFKGKTLSNTSFAFLEEKVNKFPYQCDYLKKMLKDHSHEIRDELLKKIKYDVHSQVSGAELANTITEISDSILHDLSEEDQNIVNLKLSEAIAGLKGTAILKGANFENLKMIGSIISENNELLHTLPFILNALEKSEFDTSSLMNFAIQNATNPNSEPKVIMQEFLTSMASALNNKDESVVFMNKLISYSESMPDTIDLTLSILEQFHYKDPINCAHIHEAFFSKSLIMHYLKEIPEQDRIALTSSNGEPLEIEKSLKNIIEKPFSEISAQDYKNILNEMDKDPKFNIIKPMWQIFLNAGWQHTVIESEGNKSLMPVNASTITEKEDAFGNYLYGNPELRDAYLKELIEKNPETENRLNKTHKGLAHSEKTGEIIKDSDKKLNTKFSATAVITSLMNSSDTGKSIMALNQMRNEALLLTGKFSKNVDYGDLNAEQLLSLPKRTDGTLANLVYVFSDKTELLKEKTDKLRNEIRNPLVNNVIEANRQEYIKNNKDVPDTQTIVKNCAKIATQVKTLGENLVDDLYTYNDVNLEKFGIKDPQNLRISQENLDKMKQYNLILLNKNAGLLTDKEFEESVAPLSLEDLNKQFDSVLENLKQNIKIFANSSPLSKLGELLMKKYTQIYSVRFGAELAMLEVSSQQTQKLLSDERYLDEEAYLKNPEKDLKGNVMSYEEFVRFKENQIQDESKSMYLSVYASNSPLFDGHFSIKQNGPLLLENAVIHEMMLQCDLSDEMEETITEALSKDSLSDDEKRYLLLKLNEKQGLINLDNLSSADKPDLNFVDTLNNLVRSNPGEEFNSKLNAFINEELTADRQLNANAILLSHSYQIKNMSEVDEIISKEALVGNNKSEALENVYKQQKNILLSQIEKNVQTNKEIKKLTNSLTPYVREIYRDPMIHNYLRFAGCYAASVMHYTGSQDLFEKYHQMSDADKRKAEDLMVEALVKQKFDPAMAKILVLQRFNDPLNTWLHNTIIRGLRNLAFSMRSGGVSVNKKAKQIQLRNTMLLVKELIGSIAKNKILSVQRDWNLSIDPMNILTKTGVVPTSPTLPKFSAAIQLLGSSGFTLNRDKNGRIHFFADLSKVVGVGLKAGASMSNLGIQGNISLGGNIEKLNITDFAFEDDEAAIVFISKLLCKELTEEDINTAKNVAAGSKLKYGGGISAALGYAPFQGLLSYSDPNHPASNAVQKIMDVAGDVGVGFIDGINIGRVGVSINVQNSTSTVEDINGTTETTTTHFFFTGETNLVHGGNFDGAVHSAGNLIAQTAVKYGNLVAGGNEESSEKYLNKLDNVTNKTGSALNKKFVKDFINKKTVVHYPLSSVSPRIPDAATLTIESSKLTQEHIDRMKENGLVGKDTINFLQTLLNSGREDQISYVNTVFKLKQSAIDEMKAHPEKIKSILKSKDNYEFDSIDLEFPKQSNTTQTGASLFVGGVGSIIGLGFTDKATTKGTEIISYKVKVLQ